MDMTTKEVLWREIANLGLDSKPPFSACALSALIKEINAAPEILEGDWRRMIGAAFRLSTEQARSLVEVPPVRVSEIQTYFERAAKYIQQDAKLIARIVERPVEEQTAEAVHEVQVDLIELPVSAPGFESQAPKMLRIAHCDANCRNWHWNSL